LAIWGKKISGPEPVVSVANGHGAPQSTAIDHDDWRASTWQNQFGTSAAPLPPSPPDDDLVLTSDMIEGEEAQAAPPAPVEMAEPVPEPLEPVVAEHAPLAAEPPAPEPEPEPVPMRAAAPAPEAPERTDDSGRSQFFAGRGVKLKAEVSGCDVFRIEGDFDGTVVARRMFIAPTGVFKGTGTVEEAVVEGRIEGTLIVTGVLALRSTGRVTGSISYGLIEIERGGHLHGDIMPKATETAAARPAPVAAPPSPPPVRVSAPKPIAPPPEPMPPPPAAIRKPTLAPLSFGAKRAPN